MGRKNRTSMRAITAAERAAQACELRVSGHTLGYIAGQLGYSTPSAAWKAIHRGLSERQAHSADALRKLADLRLEAVIAANWPGMERGEVGASKVILQATEGITRLHGLNAPAKVAVDMAPEIRKMAEAAGYSPEEVEEVLAEAEAILHASGLAKGERRGR